jgi:hypothetical protein
MAGGIICPKFQKSIWLIYFMFGEVVFIPSLTGEHRTFKTQQLSTSHCQYGRFRAESEINNFLSATELLLPVECKIPLNFLVCEIFLL